MEVYRVACTFSEALVGCFLHIASQNPNVPMCLCVISTSSKLLSVNFQTLPPYACLSDWKKNSADYATFSHIGKKMCGKVVLRGV